MAFAIALDPPLPSMAQISIHFFTPLSQKNITLKSSL